MKMIEYNKLLERYKNDILKEKLEVEKTIKLLSFFLGVELKPIDNKTFNISIILYLDKLSDIYSVSNDVYDDDGIGIFTKNYDVLLSINNVVENKKFKAERFKNEIKKELRKQEEYYKKYTELEKSANATISILKECGDKILALKENDCIMRKLLQSELKYLL